MNSAEIEQQLKQLIDYVRDCDRRVAKGEIMDLKGLDRNVIEICDHVAGLSPQDARQLESGLAQMVSELEILANTLRAQQEQIDQKQQVR